jgi:hypothetical protein
LGYIPTAEELEQISSYPDDRSKLGKAEQYFWEIRVTPLFPAFTRHTRHTRHIDTHTHDTRGTRSARAHCECCVRPQTIPRLEARLKAFLFKLKYPELRDSVRPVRRTSAPLHFSPASPRVSCVVRASCVSCVVCAEQDVDAVLAACDEVKKSTKFKKVLEVVLALGNYLNGGSFRGAAYGFKLDALNKLRYVATPACSGCGARVRLL